MATNRCGAGGRFRRCSNEPVNRCQYCGHAFCVSHTYHLEDFEAVCARKRCSRKHDDLQRHTEYRAGILRRNNAGLCGVEGCGPHPGQQCSLCEGHFCEAHVSQRLYPYRYGRVFIERPASVCLWCWGRRKIWRR